MALALLLVPFASTGRAQAHADEADTRAQIDAYAQQVQDTYNAAIANGIDPASALLPLAQQQRNASEAGPSLQARAPLPSEYYLMNEGAVTDVKFQNPWGACWSFATMSAIESSILKARNSSAAADASHDEPKLSGLPASPDLSEHALAWFGLELQTTDSAGNQAGEGIQLKDRTGDKQLGGATLTTPATVLTTWQSLATEKEIPYSYREGEGFHADDKTRYSMTDPYDPASADDARSKDWSLDPSLRMSESAGMRVCETIELPSPAISDPATLVYRGYNPEATSAIKQALMEVGAVSINFQAESFKPSPSGTVHEDSDYFSYQNWCQYNSSESSLFNHAVAIVGWDDDYSAENFTGKKGKPENNGAWLVKNSWGSDAFFADRGDSEHAKQWGLKDESGHTGFFWLSYYDHTITSPIAYRMVPTTESYDNNYQYDYLGLMQCVVGFPFAVPVQAANVFTAEGNEALKAVSAQTFTQDAAVNVSVRLMSEGDVFPTDGELVAEHSETFAYAGFHTIELDKPILLKKGQRYAVVEEIPTTVNGREGGYLNLERIAEGSGLEDRDTQVVANEGETFCSVDGGANWATPEELNELFPSFTFGNALIKAFTDKASADPATLELVAGSAEAPALAKAYNGTPLSMSDVVASAKYGETAAEKGDMSFAYAPASETREAGETVAGLPANAGVCDVTVTLAGKVVEGTIYDAANATTTVRIDPAAFSYAVPDQQVKAGSGIDAVQAPATALGVNGETVAGTLAWFADEARTKPLPAGYAFSGEIGTVKPLNWTFTPAAGQTNYVADALGGTARFTLAAAGGDVPKPLASTGDSAALLAATGAAVALGALATVALATRKRKRRE